MREIKFRGVDNHYLNHSLDESKIVMRYGSLVTCDNGDLVIETNRKKYGYSGLGCQITKETLGQFTGLSDKNGVEIYEGDVVLVFGSAKRIYWSDSNTCFNGQLINAPYSISRLGELSAPAFEVIGNIHENPELLESN
jgi:uncharacterized phage protein (TIGR01671 family)